MFIDFTQHVYPENREKTPWGGVKMKILSWLAVFSAKGSRVPLTHNPSAGILPALHITFNG